LDKEKNMPEEEKIPKFRSTGRLVNWVRRRRHGERLPADREQVFLKCRDRYPLVVAEHVAEYALFVGGLDAALEHLLLVSPQNVLKYVKIVHSRGQEVDPALVQALKVGSNFLFSWALHTKKRLDEDLENALDDGTVNCPRFCFRYAKEVLRGRLPDHLENVFSKYDDAYNASKYAFEIIRGFAPCRLPDDLHTYMVMKSFQDPGNNSIKVYMEAAENTPDQIGNVSHKL
jgi:hypothetical protein